MLKTMGFFFLTCKVRLSSPCTFLCINICSANTFTPTPKPTPPARPPPPPCKPY
ncbi:hypothetical protein BAE44_0017712 [Dichanthelium oligosanthes]|uniref:Uncharacterized protein n=1 Tax=Dichanthelium oligosanthes TaxID=888268 RepID=A0A1E5V824_9POAL|nr:hypothetical protein BAE44_0017712 [Dichanthelium oligosanthes]